MTVETGVVELDGNFGIGVRLVKYRMGLHRLGYGDGFLWMVFVEIVEVGVNLGEEVEERGKSIDNLDVDRGIDMMSSVGKRKVPSLLADKHHGCS